MADSKITQLPLSPYALDKDLMVVVTGHLEEGSYPQNAKMPLSYIRRYVVRLNLISNAVSGIDTYYNSGLNILTSWTTGIHAIPGNNIEVQFDSGTPASDLYGGTGPICHSGIISTTGLNAYGGNCIDTELEYDSVWPYSGIISVTGLNAYGGNRISISTDTNWPHSGIISSTGLNTTFGNGISYAVNSTFPYTYDIRTVDRVKHINSSTTVYNTGNWYSSLTTPAETIGSNLSINDMYGSKNYSSSVKVLVTAMFKISSINLEGVPSVTYGSWDARRAEELSHLTGTTYNFNYYGPCIGGDPNTRPYNNGSITWTTGDLALFSQLNTPYIDNTCTLTVGISGGGSLHNSTISPALSFVNYESPYFRSNNHMMYLKDKDINITDIGVIDGHSHTIAFADSPYTENANIRVGSIEPIILRTVVTLYNTNADAINDNSIGLYATLSNVRYQRNYQSASLATSYDDCSSTSSVYYTTSVYGYAKTNATINCQILKIEHIV